MKALAAGFKLKRQLLVSGGIAREDWLDEQERRGTLSARRETTRDERAGPRAAVSRRKMLDVGFGGTAEVDDPTTGK